ncbi:MAG: septum formation initiator family protein [Rikenellaceae bacterium]|nr:septum formation initiator family protein [Rikenellaceae bacterium]
MLLYTLKNNKLFIITLIVFVVLVTFLDKNSLINNWQVRGKIRDLEQQKKFYMEKIAEDSLMLENLKDNKFLEKYARENFYMKRKNETIYIVK